MTEAPSRGVARCDGCKYWNLFGNSISKIGECRAYPPHLNPQQYLKRPRDKVSGRMGVWPSTWEYEWCGQYEAFDD